MIKKFWPVGFLFLFWFLFSYPFFIKNLVPYPSTYQVNFFSPWSRYGNYASPVKNNAMPDVIDQIYPWKHFSLEQLQKGSLPLWNPNSFSGTPHIANYQSAVFSPFTFLYFIFSFLDAWSLIILLQPLLAGLCTYLYLRQVKVSQSGSLIGSIAFMFSGFIVVWMAYGTLSMVIAFLPLILYCVEKCFTKKSSFAFMGISIFLAISLLSGHFQMSIYVTGMVLLYILYKSYTSEDKKNAIFSGIFVILGIGIAMVQILPSLEFYANALRNKAFTTGGGIPYYNLITAFAPDFFGNPVTRNNQFLDYAEWQAFIGGIPILLAVFVIVKRKSLQLFFLVVAVFSVFLAIASPLQMLIGQLHIPVISTSVQSRIIGIFSFSVAVLSGFGYDALRLCLKEKRYKIIRIKIFSLFFLLGSIWGLILLGKVLPADQLQIAKKNLVLPTLVFFIGSISIIVSLYIPKRKVSFYLACILIGLCAFESLRFASKWMPFDPKALVFPNEKVITFLQKNQKNARVFGNIGGQTEIYYGLPSVDGYDSLYIERYGEFIAGATSGIFTSPTNRVVALSRVSTHTDRVVDLLGVSLIFHPVADTNANWAYPVWQKKWMQPIYTDTTYTIYKNIHALPRAKMFYAYETVPGKEQLLKRFYNSKFTYKDTLLLEEKISLKDYKNVSNTVEVSSYTPNSITLQVTTQKPGMLFLSDPYYPGWKAYVNGKETKIYRVDYAFRAVEIGKGHHTVIFSYEPLSFFLGTAISITSVICILILSFFIAKRQRS